MANAFYRQFIFLWFEKGWGGGHKFLTSFWKGVSLLLVFITKFNNRRVGVNFMTKSCDIIYRRPHEESHQAECCTHALFPHRHARQPETLRTAGIKAVEIILGLQSTNYTQTASRQINRPAPYRRHMNSISKQRDQHLTNPTYKN
jgi:hypothetical protein